MARQDCLLTRCVFQDLDFGKQDQGHFDRVDLHASTCWFGILHGPPRLVRWTCRSATEKTYLLDLAFY